MSFQIMKHYLWYGGVAVVGLFAGIYLRGYSDGKGWTTPTP